MMQTPIKNLKDPRGAELLQALAELANWKPQTSRPTPADDVAHGRGPAFVKYELVRTCVGAVADVEAERKLWMY
jgi:nicotinate dehydrogenase subunit B